jgi:hypothetical protein
MYNTSTAMHHKHVRKAFHLHVTRSITPPERTAKQSKTDTRMPSTVISVSPSCSQCCRQHHSVARGVQKGFHQVRHSSLTLQAHAAVHSMSATPRDTKKIQVMPLQRPKDIFTHRTRMTTDTRKASHQGNCCITPDTTCHAVDCPKTARLQCYFHNHPNKTMHAPERLGGTKPNTSMHSTTAPYSAAGAAA